MGLLALNLVFTTWLCNRRDGNSMFMAVALVNIFSQKGVHFLDNFYGSSTNLR